MGRIMQKEAEELIWTEGFKSGGQAVSRWMFVCLHEVCVCVYVLSCLTFLAAHLALCVGLILVF